MIGDDNLQIREVTEWWRTTMYDVKSNTIHVVPLAGGKPSVDQNIRQPPTPPEDEKRLIMKGRLDESQELIDVMKLGIKWEHSQLNKDHHFYKYLRQNQNKARE